jgi:hypothetical protein
VYCVSRIFNLHDQVLLRKKAVRGNLLKCLNCLSIFVKKNREDELLFGERKEGAGDIERNIALPDQGWAGSARQAYK